MNSKQEKKLQGILTKAHHDFDKGLNTRAFFKVNNRAISGDLVQDTFIKTWSYLVKGGKIDVMKAFLYHVLNNLIVDQYRKHKSVSLEVLLEKGFELSVNDQGRIFNILDGKAAILLITRLPKTYQKVMRMRYIQDLSIKEISLITRMKIKERFRLGKVRKAQEGHIIVSEAPYGYTFILKKGKRGDADFLQGHYEINEREMQIVKSIFSWVDNDGLRLRGIVRRLQELGIPPRKSKRGVWNTSTLSTLLRNRTYIGEGHYGASYATVPVNPTKKGGYKKVKKTSRRMKPENEWIKIPTPKIIDEELFNRVGQILRSNFEMSVRNTKNEYLLTGKIWCNCGKRRAGEGPQRGKHLYYRCTDRIKSFPLQPNCKEKGLNARIVDPLVWKKTKELMTSPGLLVKQIERWRNNQDKGTNNTSTINTEETKKEVTKLKDQEDRYAKAYGAGVITIEQLKEYLIPIKDKKSSFEKQIAMADLESQQLGVKTFPELNQIEAFTQKTSKALSGNLSFDSKKAIIRNVIDRVVGTRENLQVYGYIPVESNINVFTFNRNRRSTKCRKIDSF